MRLPGSGVGSKTASSREARELLSARERGEHQLGLVYVVSAREDGSVVTEMPSDEQAAQVRLSVGDPQPGYFGYPKAMRPRASSFS